MAIIKCKMCGGDLNLVEGASTAECEFCGSIQTIPKVDDEKKITLFARANRLRAACEFDKAAGIYEAIVADFPEEAEAYWGLVLCTYGIEYVDDPATCRKIPTCHRSGFESVMRDPNVDLAQEYADVAARRIYRAEAKQIEELRKGIIAVSANEEPYDVFICYKETGFDGNRTLDSVLAQDIYDALTDKDYRVFFSRISLEDKLGTEYEPYIFAALNSAKIMLVVGTDFEHFNAVWVKNEWSRFLKLMAQDNSRHLIPCYKGIDAYDMPEEFARLQAQDLDKMGAIQDIVRGVQKLLPKQKQEVIESAQTATVSTTAPLLKRANMFLEDHNWDKANEYFEKVLDIDPENAQAYLGKLMVELKVGYKGFLEYEVNRFDDNSNYIKAKRYGDETIRQLLDDSITSILERQYTKALEAMSQAESSDSFREVAALFSKLGSYRDAQAYVTKCNEQAAQAQKAEEERLPTVRKKLKKASQCIGAGIDISVALKADGTVLAKKLERTYGSTSYVYDCDIRELAKWKNIVAVSVGQWGIFGLMANGTVVSTRKLANEKFSKWTDLVAVSHGGFHDVGLKTDGTVLSVGNNDNGQCNVEKWTEIVAVSAGYYHTVGLKADGTVVAVGKNSDSQCDVEGWTDIVAVSAGYYHTVGLKADGTVVTTGFDLVISEWRDIVAVSAGKYQTIGLKSDGTVVAYGSGSYSNVEGWSDIVAVSAGETHTLGLKSDGTVVATGAYYSEKRKETGWRLFQSYDTLEEERKELAAKAQAEFLEKTKRLAPLREKYSLAAKCLDAGWLYTVGLKTDGTVIAVGLNDRKQCNVSNWKDIIAISAGRFHVVGLKADSRVVAVGGNGYGECHVAGWNNIVAISAGGGHTVGLKADSRVVAVGGNGYGQCNVAGWNNIVAISAGGSHTVGLKADGTVIAVGQNDLSCCDVERWTDIVAISAGSSHTVGLKADGTVVAVGYDVEGFCDVDDWTDIIAISAGDHYTVGLKADGTVVAAGKKDDGRSQVERWTNIVAIMAGDDHIVGLKADGTVITTTFINGTPDKLNGHVSLNNVRTWRLFRNVESVESERQTIIAQQRAEEARREAERVARLKREEEERIARLKRQEEERIARMKREEEMRKRRNAGKCQHCGGDLKGLFSKKCVSCGKPKDY